MEHNWTVVLVVIKDEIMEFGKKTQKEFGEGKGEGHIDAMLIH